MIKLVNLVFKRAKMEDSVFLDFNKMSSLSSEFEELYQVRRDLASLLKNICKCCGPSTIYAILSQYLSQAIAREGQIGSTENAVSVYVDIECLLFCITQLVKCMDTAEIGQIKDVVLLV